MQTTGIIMAGGKNSRMGRDKACLHVGTETILENTVNQLTKVVNNILVISNRPQSLSGSGLHIVPDIFPGCGPLGGIHAWLVHSTTDVNLVVACDMPFLHEKMLKYLVEHGARYDVVIPRLGNYLEPLTACYHKSCLQVIESHINERRLKITSFFPEVDVLYVERKKLTELAGTDYSFFNVNTPEDLEQARDIKKRLGLPAKG